MERANLSHLTIHLFILTKPGHLDIIIAVKFRLFYQRWFQIAVGGILLFIVAEIALVTTGNPLFFPTVILLGAFVIPVVFVTYFYEYVRDRDISIPLLTTCFVVGGIIGVITAGFIEYGTLRNMGVASLFGVGLIEETVKLIFPIIMFVIWKYRHEADGLLFGVAAGMGFAAMETMGYAMVNLIQSRGDVGVLQQVLLIRGLLSPSGHAAWTGFVCAILWRHRQLTGHPVGWSVIGAFLAAIALHSLWDVVSSINVKTPGQLALYIVLLLALIIVSLFLVIWRFRKARAFALKASSASSQS
jgi:RsiW-degrading membrane proteinase PrsW (M82 family)